jgi:hypothetical protein
MTTTQTTAGQELAATLRRYFPIGTRTRRYRKDSYGCRQDLHAKMAEAITYAATLPGYHTERTQVALAAGFGAALPYDKHVKGHRVPGILAQRINAMTPWQFAGLLGDLVDAGVTSTGEGERFFAEMARAS